MLRYMPSLRIVTYHNKLTMRQKQRQCGNYGQSKKVSPLLWHKLATQTNFPNHRWRRLRRWRGDGGGGDVFGGDGGDGGGGDGLGGGGDSGLLHGVYLSADPFPSQD